VLEETRQWAGILEAVTERGVAVRAGAGGWVGRALPGLAAIVFAMRAATANPIELDIRASAGRVPNVAAR
jgi:hypothetical protein